MLGVGGKKEGIWRGRGSFVCSGGRRGSFSDNRAQASESASDVEYLQEDVGKNLCYYTFSTYINNV